MAMPYELRHLVPTPLDPQRDAQTEAQFLRRVDWTAASAIDRVAADTPPLNRETLIKGLVAFHRERMQAVPDRTRFPESPRWVEHTLKRDALLADALGLSETDLAVLRSLHQFMAFRGWLDPTICTSSAKPTGPPPVPSRERCRIAYVPESSWGEVHLKNLDDPLPGFNPRPTPEGLDRPPLVHDGVGSGLHLDTEPDELFPLNPRVMMVHETDDTPGAVALLARYHAFWGRTNIIVYDRQRRAVAIEKCGFGPMEVYEPNAKGAVHVSGMVCRDPDSPQGRHQAEMRRRYLDRFQRPANGADGAFWSACDRAERMLADALWPGPNASGPIDIDALWKLFHTPWPDGLCKEGRPLHPEQTVYEYTLSSYVIAWTQQRMVRRQRDPKSALMPTVDEVHRF